MLSIASEAYPLIKTGGLADVVGALPSALAREGVEARTLLPGYPQVLASSSTPSGSTTIPYLFGGYARSARRRARRGSTSSCSKRRISMIGRAIRILAPTAATGPTTPNATPRWRASAPTSAKGAVDELHARRRAGARLAGRRSRPPISITTAARGRATVVTVHNIAFQGHYPVALFPTLGLPPTRSRSTASNISAASATSRRACRSRTASPRCRRPMRAEIMTPEFGMALDGLLETRAAVVQASSTGSTTRCGTRRPTRPCAKLSRAARRQRERKVAPRCRSGSAWSPIATAPLFGVVSRLD